MKGILLATLLAAPIPEPEPETWWLMTLNPATKAQVAWPHYPPNAKRKCEEMKSYGAAVIGIFGRGFLYCASESTLMKMVDDIKEQSE